MRRECTRCSPRVSSTSSSSSVIPSLMGMGGRGRLWQTLLLSRWRSVLAWLPVESAIRKRQADYYEALAYAFGCRGSCEFRGVHAQGDPRIGLPYVKPSRSQDVAQRSLPSGDHATVTQLAQYLGCSKRSAERTVASSKKKACSSARAVPVRACGLSTPRTLRLRSPCIGVGTPPLHDESSR